MSTRPYQTLDSSGLLVFDGLQAVCWLVHMRSDVISPRIINVSAGQLYTFIFAQDAIGDHLMRWPNACQNAAPIDPTPNSRTVQNFIGDTGGLLQANISPAWGKP